MIKFLFLFKTCVLFDLLIFNFIWNGFDLLFGLALSFFLLPLISHSLLPRYILLFLFLWRFDELINRIYLNRLFFLRRFWFQLLFFRGLFGYKITRLFLSHCLFSFLNSLLHRVLFVLLIL